jgi:hypothetical protein
MPVPDDEQIRAAAARQRVEFSQNRAFEDDGRARRAQSVPLRERAEFPFGDRSRVRAAGSVKDVNEDERPRTCVPAGRRLRPCSPVGHPQDRGRR